MSNYEIAQPYNKNLNEQSRKNAQIINAIMQGKTNNTGSVTLTENSATTVVSEAQGRIGQDTVILFMPTTANAATEFGAGTMYVSSRDIANNTFTITHVNNSQDNRIFYYVLIG